MRRTRARQTLRSGWGPPESVSKWGNARRRPLKIFAIGHSSLNFMPIGTQWRANERLGGRATSLRQILAELDHDHDRRADCYHHRADKRQLFQQADDGRPNAESSLHMREAPACHTHRTSPFDPSSSGLIFNAKRAPAIANSGVPWIKVKEPLQGRWS